VFPSTAGRKCQAKWFIDHRWLHYCEDKDAVFCYLCVKASHMVQKHDLSWFNSAEPAFVVTGFKNWKKATERFRDHEKSNFHCKNVEMIFLREKTETVTAQLDKNLRREQEEARICLRTVISSIRYLCRSGNALRGHDHEGGNLMELLEERTLDVPLLHQWLERRYSFVSSDIQNEIVEIMAHAVLRDVANEIRACPFFSVIADGTTDVGGLEQFSLCARYVSLEDLEPKEAFLGMYNPEDSKGKTLASATKDVLLRLNLSLQNLRGACFDGASNMSGREKGVQRLLKDDQPKTLYVHCCNHAADLALQEVTKEVTGMCELLMLVKDASNIILESAKRKKMFENIVLPPCCDAGVVPNKPKQLLPLCPTRWCVRVKSLGRFKSEYARVKKTLEELLTDPSACTPERKATVRGYLKRMEKFKTKFFLHLGLSVFTPCEELAKALQKPSLTATGAKQAANIVIASLEELRSDEQFESLYSETSKFDERLRSIDSVVTGNCPGTSTEDCRETRSGETVSQNPVLCRDASNEKTVSELGRGKRDKRPPLRLEHIGNPAPPVELTFKESLRKDYFETLDLLINELQRRFQQEDLDTLENLENILLDAYRGTVPSQEKLKERLGCFAEDFELDDLHPQLKMLKNQKNTPDEKNPTSCQDIAHRLSQMPETSRNLFDQVFLLVALVLTVPASAASSERSFSALRKVKDYTRATMTQKRLTHLLLLKIHARRTQSLNLDEVMKEFVNRSIDRKRVFGKF